MKVKIKKEALGKPCQKMNCRNDHIYCFPDEIILEAEPVGEECVHCENERCEKCSPEEHKEKPQKIEELESAYYTELPKLLSTLNLFKNKLNELTRAINNR